MLNLTFIIVNLCTKIITNLETDKIYFGWVRITEVGDSFQFQ